MPITIVSKRPLATAPSATPAAAPPVTIVAKRRLVEEPPMAVSHAKDDEPAFRSWYAAQAAKHDLNPNPDAPDQQYDYRAAFRAGAKPGPDGHWPSAFKKPGHPNEVVGGFNTRTGERVPGTRQASYAELIDLGWAPDAAARLSPPDLSHAPYRPPTPPVQGPPEGAGLSVFRSSAPEGPNQPAPGRMPVPPLNPIFAPLSRATEFQQGTAERTPVQMLKEAPARIPRAVAAGGFQGITRTVWGAMQMTADALGLQSVANFAASADQQAVDMAAGIKGKQTDLGFTEAAVYSGMESIGQSAPSLVAGAVTGNPAVAYGAMGLATGMPSYSDDRKAGVPALNAFGNAVSKGLIEVVTERVPVINLLNDLTAGTGAVKTVLRQLAEEIPNEQYATFLQDLSDWATKNDRPFVDYLAERPSAAAQTFIATLVATVGQTGGALAMDRARRKLNQDESTPETQGEAALNEATVNAKLDRARVLGYDPDEPVAATPAPPLTAEITPEIAPNATAGESSAPPSLPPDATVAPQSVIPAEQRAQLEALGHDPDALTLIDAQEILRGGPVAPLPPAVGTAAIAEPMSPEGIAAIGIDYASNPATRAAVEKMQNAERQEAPPRDTVAPLAEPTPPVDETPAPKLTFRQQGEQILAANPGISNDDFAAALGVRNFGTAMALRNSIEQAQPAAETPAEPVEVSPQEQSYRDAAANYSAVQANPEAASAKDLRRAAGYGGHQRIAYLRKMEQEGRQPDADKLAAFASDDTYFTKLANEKDATARATPPWERKRRVEQARAETVDTPVPTQETIPADDQPGVASTAPEGPTGDARRRRAPARLPAYTSPKRQRVPIYDAVIARARAVDPNVDEAVVRAGFDERLDAYDDLTDDNDAADSDPRTLLKAIADLGGIYEKDDGKGQAGEMARLREGQAFGRVGGIAGVMAAKPRALQNVVKKVDGKVELRQEARGGLPLDVILQDLQADGRFPWLHDLDDLTSFIDDVQKHGVDRAPKTPDDARLKAMGMDPATAWWNERLIQREPRADDEFNPAALEAETEKPLTHETLRDAFQITDQEAAAVMTLVEAMGLDTSKILVVRGGEPGSGSMQQFANLRGTTLSLDELQARGFDTTTPYYHQTAATSVEPIMRDGFDLSKGRARLSDEGVPDGVFFKSNQRDIGVGASGLPGNETAQIPVYLRLGHVIKFANREALEARLGRDAEYARMVSALRAYDAEQGRLFDKRFDEQGKMERGDFERANRELDEWIERWKAENERLATLARARATELLKAEGVETVVIEKDRGSFGRATDTVIVIGSDQVAAAMPSGDAKVLYQNGRGLFDDDADVLDTGEVQPRLPGDVGQVRNEERPTPKLSDVDDEFRLTPQFDKRKAKQHVLFQSGNAQAVMPEGAWYFDNILSALPQWQAKGTPEQLLAHLKKTKGAMDEAADIGLVEWLQGKTSVTRADVDAYVQAHKVNLAEKTLGPDQTKYESYQLDGPKENYREILLTLPQKPAEGLSAARADVFAAQQEYKRLLALWDGRDEMEQPAVRDLSRQIIAQRGVLEAAERKVDETRESRVYRAPHFDGEPNILLHLRVNDRTLADGRRVLFMEELQSDWHQQGRRKGYRKASDTSKPYVVTSLGRELSRWGSEQEAQDWADAHRRDVPPGTMRVDHEAGAGAIPDAPLKDSGWKKLGLKRLLAYAAEGGYDGVAWTTGDQQNERYDLSKQIGRVWAKRNTDADDSYELVVDDKNGNGIYDTARTGPLTGDELEDVIGKEMTEKIIAQPDGPQDYTGLDLKVGGKGMVGFYDRELPNLANDLAKKFGQRVERGQVDTSGAEKNNYAIYTGPTRTIEDVRTVLAASRKIGNTMTSPITGGRLSYSLERVFNSMAAEKVADAMAAGQTFKQAMEAQGNGDLAEIFGGSIEYKSEPITSDAQVHVLATPDSMRDEIRAKGFALFQAAWHGSPHIFEQFSLHKIGTGEGAQAYGWGLYFAGKKSVAQWYRETLAKRQDARYETFKIADGRELPWEQFREALADEVDRRHGGENTVAFLWAGHIAHALHYNEMTYDQALSGLKSSVEKANEPLAPSIASRREAAMRTFEEVVKEWAPRNAKERSRGRLYKVDIPEDSEYLDWDKPLSEQSEKVRAALAELGADTSAERWQTHQVTAADKAAKRFNSAAEGSWVVVLGASTNGTWGGGIFSSKAQAEKNAEARDGMEGRVATGQDIYNKLIAKNPTAAKDNGWSSVAQTLNDAAGSPRAASEALAKVGVAGIRYLDGSSRNRSWKNVRKDVFAELPDNADFDEVMDGIDSYKPEHAALLRGLAADEWLGFDYPAQAITAALDPAQAGTYDMSPALRQAVSTLLDAVQGSYNYVVFDDQLVKVLEYEQKNKASVEFLEDGKSLVRAFESADVSSAVHEIWHVARRFLLNKDVPQELRRGITDADIDRAYEAFGVKPGGKWSVAAEEKFARAGERYLRDGATPSTPKALHGIFQAFQRWLVDIYRSLTGSAIDVKISPEMRAVFDRLVSRSERLKAMDAKAAKTLPPAVAAKTETPAPPKRTAPVEAKPAVATKPGKAEAFSAVEDAVKARMKERGTGDVLYQRQDQTDTPEFRRWFGSSAVVDDSDRPMVVYHGTTADVSEFTKEGSGEFGRGHYFAPRADSAAFFGGRGGETGLNIMPVYLSMQNPMRVDVAKGGRDKVRAMGQKKIRALGYDGIIATGLTGDVQYVVFDAAQIKSAIGNQGTFDSRNPSILYQSKPTLPLDNVEDLQVIGAAKIARGFTTRKTFDAEMTREFGAGIAPMLDALYPVAKERAEVAQSIDVEDYFNFRRIDVSDTEKAALTGSILESILRTGRIPKERESWQTLKDEAAQLGPEAVKELAPFQQAQAPFRAVRLAARRRINVLNQEIVEARKALNGAPQEEAVERELALAAKERDVQGLLNTWMRMRSEDGRNLAMHRITIDSMETWYDDLFWLARAKREIGLPHSMDLPVDVLRALQDILNRGREATETGRAVEPIQLELARFMTSLRRSTLLETIAAVRKAGLLTGPKTHMRNVGGNAAFTALEEIARVPAVLVDMAVATATGRRTVHGVSPVAIARSSREAATNGLKQAAEVMRDGTTAADLVRMDGARELNSGVRWLDAYVNFVFRTMGATDRVFKSYAFRRSLEEQAALEAINRGVSPLELLANPTATMLARATADAEFATFNNPNIMAQALTHAKGALKREAGAGGKTAAFIIDLAIPFANTPSNIIARMLDYTPVGLTRGVTKAAISVAVNKSMTADQQQMFSKAIGRGLTGSALMYLGWQLAAAGLASGLGGDDPGDRNVRDAAGILAGALRIGDRWHQISTFSPAGNLVTIGATMQRTATQPLRKEAMRTGKMVAIGARIVLEQPMLKGMNDIIESLQRPEARGEAVISSTVGSFVPTFVNDIGSAFDPYRRDTRPDGGFRASLLTGAQSRLPGLRNHLDPRINVFGEKQDQTVRAIWDPTIAQVARDLNDPVLQALVKHDVGLGWPQKKDGETTADYTERVRMVGAAVKARIGEVLSSNAYRTGDDEAQAGLLEDAIAKARTDTRAKPTKQPPKRFQFSKRRRQE